ncbi:MAG: LamG domain-containing protein [Candidatus Freyarchaeota archaeon]|nr:LamG domain-containing protein [Candidatus Jordarchaeia archaeon]
MLLHIKNYEIEDKIYSKLVASIKYFLVFVVSYVLILTIVDVTNIKYVSAIDLGLFSLFLALLITSSVLLLEKNHSFLQMYLPKIVKIDNILPLRIIPVIGSIVFFLAYLVVNSTTYYYYIAFEEWYTISPFRLLVSIVILLELLYIPAYILHRTVLHRFKLSIQERLVFYPVISALPLTLMGVFSASLRFEVFYKELFLLFLNVAIIMLLLHDCRINRDSYSLSKHVGININKAEIFGILAAVAFNFFIFYSAIGGENAFLRGDMWGGANQIAVLSKYGVGGYLNSPVMTYPILYGLFWSALLGFLPIPFINGLIMIAFFNHAFSILALYTLAKILFKDTKSALITIILWTAFSGFSWLYAVLNHPLQMLAGNDLLNYIIKIHIHFGVFSGAIVSPIYADDHALTRLWSLGLVFASTAALLKGYLNKSPIEGLLVFSAGLFQITSGHVTEIPLLAIILFTLLLIEKKHSTSFTIKAFFMMIAVPIVSIIILIFLKTLQEIYIVVFFLPMLAILLATVLNKNSTYLKELFSKRFLDKMLKNIKIVLIILFLFLYGLMWVAFWTKYPYVFINWPIFTVWYAPAIEWGFLGLMAALTLVWLGFKEKWEFGLKFVVFILAFQVLLIFALNYLNYNFYYIQTPFPFQPILFLPNLALVSSQGFTLVKLSCPKKSFSRKIKLYIFIIIIILLFSFGSLDHILSASFWKTNNGWWFARPLNPTYSDYQLINFLYLLPATSSYEFVATFYDWNNPETYVIYPSGLTALSSPLIDIIANTNDSREIYLLSHVFPIKYILVSNAYPPPTNSYLSNAIKTINPIFANAKYKMYSLSQLNLSKTESLPISDKFLTAENIIFKGDISWIHYNGTMFLHKVSGAIYPINDGRVIILVEPSNGFTGNTLGDKGLEGCIFYITMNEGEGYKIYDKSGYGNNGTIYGAIWTDGRIGKALYFDGVDNYVHVPDSPSLRTTSDWTRTIWVYSNTPLSGDGKIHDIWSQRTDSNKFLLRIIGDGKWILHYRDTTGGYPAIYLQKFSQEWVCVQVVKNGTNIKVYQNGVVTAEANNAGDWPDDDHSIYFGSYRTGTTFFFNGILDEVRIYNRALSADEVFNDFAEGFIKFESLTPIVTIVGTLTLNKMRSTWGYFDEIKCFADNLTISGGASFRIFNSFETRIYIELFSYCGGYNSFPIPQFLSQPYAKQQIERYMRANYVSPLQILTTPMGTLWTITIIAILLIGLIPLMRGCSHNSSRLFFRCLKTRGVT